MHLARLFACASRVEEVLSGGKWRAGLDCRAVLVYIAISAGQITNSLKTSDRLPDRGLKVLTPSQPGSELQPGMFSSVGEPTKSKMASAWLRSLFPAKIGRPLNISPNTQLPGLSADVILVQLSSTHPAPHRSIAGVYRRNCSKSSGGRYHLVTTRVV